MTNGEIELLEYTTEGDKIPFRIWLQGLKDRVARARIWVRLNRIRLGNFGDCKSVGKGVSELRITYDPGYRVYFGRDGLAVVILLCGGDKNTQSKDIELAQKYWDDYKKRSS